MLNSVLAIVKNGKIETLEHIELPEGKKVLITMLPDDDTFWQEASEETLKRIWDNKEDDVYARLLDECGNNQDLMSRRLLNEGYIPFTRIDS